ncbi:hypothetical protein Celaphus_00006394 [Cervus elaphus hippelaphus]|uniref:Uncharacterized protein n=1 Tax=Cervus elaphus hippelaphus TaxID=46360 RepID=A0A212CTP8_CEREH|nr:hypothetical protein Celaphus_00006394 [Cervus elaphus hippelaphus]
MGIPYSAQRKEREVVLRNRQPQLVPKPETMSSDGGESASRGGSPATSSLLGDSKLDTLPGGELSGLT